MKTNLDRPLQKLFWGGRLARPRIYLMERFTVIPCLVLAIFSLFLLSGCQRTPKVNGVTIQAEVISGQTLEVTGVGDRPTLIQRVRLIGIEAPDVKQRPWGPEAKKRLEELVGKEPVLLESDVETKDSFDRKLAYVWKNGVLLNEQMVKEGWALFQSRSPATKYDERLEGAQEWARLMGLGIWNPEKPMRQNPSEFRRQNR